MAALESTCRYLAYRLGQQGMRACNLAKKVLKTQAASGLKDFELMLNSAARKGPWANSSTSRMWAGLARSVDSRTCYGACGSVAGEERAQALTHLGI